VLLQIESVKLSKSGKSYWVVTSSGKGYSSKALGIEQTAGKMIDAVTNQFQIGTDMVDAIQSFTVASQPPQATPSAMPHVSQITPLPGPATVAKDLVDRFWLPFVSNQVAHAIAAGLIKEPGDMNLWAKAAYNAVNNADDVPF
jgi:hypothetical protein